MPIKNILVVGGAGFVGSHMAMLLKQVGYKPIILDNLNKGHRESTLDAELIVGDIADKKTLSEVFSKYEFCAVMHFASFIDVAESVKNPGAYYHNNVAALLNLLDVMHENKVKDFLFSSSAAVYGEPGVPRIHEGIKLDPINPYGRSKRMAEEMIKDYAQAGLLNYGILRYFNASGADPAGRLGEMHSPETHLIPLLLQVALGQKKNITINGIKHATADGTCIRDYVHVSDICNAHLLALKALHNGKSNVLFNLGTGTGYSVNQVISAARRVTGHAIPTVDGVMRAGDPAVLVADPSLAIEELNWKPQHKELDTIIQHAWQFAQKNHKKT